MSEDSEAGLSIKRSCLVQTLGVTQLTESMILVTLCCATYVRLKRLTNTPLGPELKLFTSQSKNVRNKLAFPILLNVCG